MPHEDLGSLLALLQANGVKSYDPQTGKLEFFAPTPTGDDLTPKDLDERDARRLKALEEWQRRITFGAAGGVR